ncbi:hypothetical protein AB1L42_21250 [Thalassoglobus sp. JC818]|uniref:hypothetical protein n=1 Tax=Thalassoglobus sp. JC818 TaxID=3232136 RepID=UPI003457C66C
MMQHKYVQSLLFILAAATVFAQPPNHQAQPTAETRAFEKERKWISDLDAQTNDWIFAAQLREGFREFAHVDAYGLQKPGSIYVSDEVDLVVNADNLFLRFGPKEAVPLPNGSLYCGIDLEKEEHRTLSNETFSDAVVVKNSSQLVVIDFKSKTMKWVDISKLPE